MVPESCTLSPGPAQGRRTVPSTKKKRMSPIIMHAAHCGRGHTAHGPSGAGVSVCAGVVRSHQRMAMLWPGRAPLSASRDVGSTLPGLQMVVLPELRAAPAQCNGAFRLTQFQECRGLLLPSFSFKTRTRAASTSFQKSFFTGMAPRGFGTSLSNKPGLPFTRGQRTAPQGSS